jgi:hypothetical protein
MAEHTNERLNYGAKPGPRNVQLKRTHYEIGVASIDGKGVAIAFGDTDANARRLVAAWNATLGLPVETLEYEPGNPFMSKVHRLLARLAEAEAAAGVLREALLWVVTEIEKGPRLSPSGLWKWAKERGRPVLAPGVGRQAAAVLAAARAVVEGRHQTNPLCPDWLARLDALDAAVQDLDAGEGTGNVRL